MRSLLTHILTWLAAVALALLFLAAPVWLDGGL